jgi:hypothetical protein
MKSILTMSSTITTVQTANVTMTLSAIALITLLMLLVTKETFYAARDVWAKVLARSLNMIVVPLTIVFVMVAVVRLSTVI